MDEVWQLYAKYHPKQEEYFQYGGRLFFKNGNSYISAVD